MRRAVAVLAALVFAPSPAAAAGPESCGAPDPTEVISGSFTSDQTGSFVMLPFDVPKGTTAIRGWYCYDQPDGPTAQLPAFAIRHTLDFGYYGPRPQGQSLWTMREYRGWSGSGFFDDITVSEQGFAADPDPSDKPVGATSRGYRPGPITPGRWAVELGVAAVVPPAQGDSDGTVNWRVELQLERDPALARPAYVKPRYDAAPARREPGWYAGDFHVHSEQSGDAKQNAPSDDVFEYAFQTAGLDFVQVTDHNTDAGWAELARSQPAHPGRLIARNEEITTYRGHVNAPGIGRIADYRTGPVFERAPDGELRQLRAARPVSELFDDVHASGGVTTINHPTIFDSAVPPFAVICRGCSWEYTDDETDYALVDAIEVATGPQGLKLDGVNPGPNPFTPLALDFYEAAQAKAGGVIAAVAGSDSHSGGTTSVDDVTGAPVGTPATMVFARELSERGIADAVAAGHTYVRAFGAASPELSFTSGDAIFGDTVHAESATFTASVRGAAAGPEPLTLLVTRDGALVEAVPVSGPDTDHVFTVQAPETGTARIGLRLMRGSAIEAFGTPISLTRAAAEPLRATVVAKRALAVRRGRVRVGCRASGEGLRACRIRVGRRVRTVPLYRAGVRRVTLRAPARRRVVVRAVALGDGSASRPTVRRVRLVRPARS